MFGIFSFVFFMDYNNKQQIKWLMCFSVMIVWCLLLMCKWDMRSGGYFRVKLYRPIFVIFDESKMLDQRNRTMLINVVERFDNERFSLIILTIEPSN